MALVPDQKFSTFQNGGDPTTGDIIVGLRGGINTKFNWVIPPTVDTIMGTANQVLVNGSAGVPVLGDVTLSTPQDIGTISSPTFANLTLGGASEIRGSNGLPVLTILSLSSAVNSIISHNQASGFYPGFSATGTDTDVGMAFVAKSAGSFTYTTTATSAIEYRTGTGSQHITDFVFPDTSATRAVTWQDASGTVAYLSDIPSGTPSALTRTDDINVTLTLGGSPSVALLAATSLTLGWSGQLSETRGGTAQSTYTLGDILYSSASNTLSKLAGNTTTAKQYLSQTGTGIVSAAPVWSTISGGDITGAALTKTDDTNVTLTLGGTPATSLLRAASLTLGWTGELSLARGGSNANLTASNGGIIYSTATAMAVLSGTATAGQLLQSGSSSAPNWTTTTYPSTNAINTIMYASSSNVLGSISAANSSVLITSSTGVPSMSGALANGQLIIGSTGATPVVANLTAGSGISISNTAGGITISGTGSGTGFTEVTGTSQAMAADAGYVTNNAGVVTLTLPVTAAFGTAITVVGKGAGGWLIAQNSGQSIQVGNQTTATGVGGSLASTNQYDSIDLVCVTANTKWVAWGAPQSAGLTFV